jgi:hypothetical protein
MDTTLDIHDIFLGALSQAFPEMLRRAKREKPKKTEEKKMLIVGGDDLGGPKNRL